MQINKIMENWKQHPIYTKYEISDLGQVRVYANKKLRRIYNHKQQENGYKGVVLFHEGKHISKLVHRLVCEAFIGFSHLEVNHKNGIKSDNQIKNLEYVTRQENMAHFYNNNPMRQNLRGLRGRAKKMFGELAVLNFPEQESI